MNASLITQSNAELGIKPWRRKWKYLVFALVALVAFFCTGALGGWFNRLSGEQRQQFCLAQIDRAIFADEIPARLTDLANAANNSPLARYYLASGFAAAAGKLPNRPALLQRALLEAENAWQGLQTTTANSASSRAERFFDQQLGRVDFSQIARDHLQLMLPLLRFEIGDERAAMEFLEQHPAPPRRENNGYDLAKHYYNLLAYIHATAKTPEIFDPQKAHAYIQLAAPDWENCDDAAILDTWAMTCFALGDKATAEKISRRAVALAPTELLTDLLPNYRHLREK